MEMRVKRLQDYQYKRSQGGPYLPNSEKANLTSKILLDIYEWLGFLYSILKNKQNSEMCYEKFEESAKNFIRFDET